jgi:hypothetical protein
MARYEAGETLASIARTYDCSPPAISYVVTRSRARGIAPSAVGAKTPASWEPLLIRSHGTGTPVDEPRRDGSAAEQTHVGGPAPASPAATATETNIQHTASSTEGIPEQPLSQGYEGNERQGIDAVRSSRPIGGPSQDHRPPQTLQLSKPNRHDRPTAGDPHHPSSYSSNSSDDPIASHLARDHQNLGQPDEQRAHHPPRGNGALARFVPDEQERKEGGAFIDLALRHRVEGDIAAFLAAFDAALSHDTSETRAGLRQATDRLLRAGARTRIELERLEARIPLPARNDDRQPERAWRQR